ncbi:hypothetical protein BHM03_00003739 [Ensete ventricosum]|nr:hypothetical protein BHM03_00003739 [Ensete ventricosum]
MQSIGTQEASDGHRTKQRWLPRLSLGASPAQLDSSMASPGEARPLRHIKPLEQRPCAELVGRLLPPLQLARNPLQQWLGHLHLLQPPVPRDLSQTLLVGELPSDIHKLSSQLLYLDLSYNNFTGDIPPSIGRLVSLHTLNLHCNFFDGSFPAELGNLSTLESLTLAYNPFASPRIPVEFGNMTRLRYLWMTQANLVGEIPEALGRLAELEHLGLALNGLSGSIPAAIWSLEKLTTLYLYDNKLTGEISGKIAALNLEEIDVSMNRLTGLIPEEFVKLGNLRILFMYYNRLSDEIPRGIGLLRDLRDVRLFDNHLVGVLPPELGQHSHLTNMRCPTTESPAACPKASLKDIQLYNNNFSGEFPQRIWSASVNLTTVLIDRNHFTGVLPDKLQWNLTRLVMNDNWFSGRIPTRAPKLAVFRGSNNMFSSEIPAELTGISDADDLLACKLTWFHQLDFTQRHIIRGLTEANLIGSGRSGQVYRVNLENRAGDAVVAVKKIRKSGKQDWKMEKAFEAEVKVLSSIRHCSIVKLLCCISSADSKLLVYEYMENGSLDRWLYGRRRTRTGSGHVRSPLDWRKRLGIAIDAAKGLCYMHHHCTPPVIHRDVKSSNILLDSDFGAKIADFGLARMLMKASEPESASAIAGTFGYMAPGEVLIKHLLHHHSGPLTEAVIVVTECGHSKKINEKVDVYSFGVVLLELTTGRKAQDGGEHEGLAGWAARRLREKKGKRNMDDIGTVLRLGIECTRRNAVLRPSMKEVLRKLTEIVGLGRQ